MPKAKKPAPFIVFVKERYPHLHLNAAIAKASAEWQALSKEQKDKYKEKTKTMEKIEIKPREKLTCQGIPISHLENERTEMEKKTRRMKAEIEEIVNSGRTTGDLPDIKFNFISVNYFSKNSDETVYTPAEIAFSVYTLRDGVLNKYHSLINPCTVPFGYAFETKQHSEDTHQLGVPPNVEGEKDLAKLYLNCLDFIRDNNNCGNNFPPIFTLESEIVVVESVLQYLKQSCCFDDDEDDVNWPKIRIYPIHYLFYLLKKTTTEMADIKPPESIHITNAFLDKDIYQYETGIACTIHEKKDRSKYCSLSCVIRWAYTFSDHLCTDLAINIEPGHHVPKNADVNNESYRPTRSIQMKEEPKSLKREKYVDSDDSGSDEFPPLSARSTKSNSKQRNEKHSISKVSNSKMEEDDDSDDDDGDQNPWSRYSRTKKLREPSNASFSINISGLGGGRGLLFNNPNEKPKNNTSRGRGLAFGD